MQAATKWKRMALAPVRHGARARACSPTCARCARTTSSTTTTAPTSTSGTGSARSPPSERTLDVPHRHRARDLEGAEGGRGVPATTPSRRSPTRATRALPDELDFLHAEDLLDAYPDLPRKQRETAILQEHPAVFIYGIGWPLADGLPHELRAADYDDWSTETTSADGRPMHGLNGDILVWNPVTRRRHELMSGGIRVTKESLVRQLELSGQLELPRAALPPGDPATTRSRSRSAAGIGQSRTMMLLLRKAHLGEVSVTVWPEVLKEMCAATQHRRARVGEPCACLCRL